MVVDKRVARSTLEELNQSVQLIARYVKNECLLEDVKEVKQNKEVKKSGKLGNPAETII